MIVMLSSTAVCHAFANKHLWFDSILSLIYSSKCIAYKNECNYKDRLFGKTKWYFKKDQ